jgi:methylenetetrahydrofolate reductase (NADPH)
MKVIDKLKAAQGRTLFTFEIMPPLKGTNFDEIAHTIERLLPYNPAYINITNHRAERIAMPSADGSMQYVQIKRRAGTAAIAAAIRYRYGVEVVPHLVCAGYSRSEVEDMLLDFAYLGIENVLALRGDAMRGEPSFVPHPQGDAHAIDVLRQIMALNDGVYIDPSIAHAAAPLNFCAGVAGYPEMHASAASMHADMCRLKEKIDAGAQYIVTQMFFDNGAYFRFVEQCSRMGINVPVIPGLKPLATKQHLLSLPSIFHITIPAELRMQVERCSDAAACRRIVTAWCIHQCRQLVSAGVPALHFYTMGKADNIESIVQEIFPINFS